MSLLTGLEAMLTEKLLAVLAKHAPKMKEEVKAKLVKVVSDFLMGAIPADTKGVKVTNAPDKFVIEIDKTLL